MTHTTHFIIKTLSNLHVGSGDQNFGVVDNLVQKDPVTEIPMINSSSLKGAIKDHFENQGKYTSKKLNTIFGYAEKDSASAGEVKFIQANLLALPVRSNTQMYFLATTPQILKDYIQNHKILKNEDINIEIPDIDQKVYISTDDSECWVEDYEADSRKKDKLKSISEKLFNGFPIALIHDKLFKTISLPIITRNKIAKHEEDDNNLFYEEIVPRNSIYYTYIITPTDIDKGDEDSLKKLFEDFIRDMNTIIQVGANASIGYGLCSFEERNYE